MRKRNAGRKFARTMDQRNAFLNSLVRNFLIHGKIRTTEARAKEIRPIVEKMITRARVASLANTRILSKVLAPSLTKKLVTEIAPAYKDRKGGYTRITKIGLRKTDAALMVMFELVK